MNDRSLQRLDPVEFYKRFAEEHIRPDGRSPSSTRAVTVTNGGIGSSDGSCSVRIGWTTLIASVSCSVSVEAPPLLEVDGPSEHDTYSSAAVLATAAPVVVNVLLPEFRGRIQTSAGIRATQLAAWLTQLFNS